MKKIFVYIYLAIFIVGQFFVSTPETKAFTQDYNFSNSSDYTISHSSAYIHGGAAKLRGTLQHRAHLENGPVALDGATNIIVDGGYAYIAGYGANAITSVDISNPANLSAVGYIGADANVKLNGAYDLKKVGNYIYVASYIDDDLEIIDASNPANLTHIGRFIDTSSTYMNGIRGIDVVGNFAYLAAYADDALQIIDVSNPSSPVKRGSLRDSGGRLNGAASVKVVGSYAYVTSYIDNSLQIIDVSDPDNPSFAGQLREDTNPSVHELRGAWGLDVVGNYAYVAGYNDDGVEIIDISNPLNPTHVGEIQNSDPGVFLNGAREIEVIGNYAYVSSYVDDSVQIIDITTPSAPSKAGVLDTNSYGRLDSVFGIAVSGTNVFVVSYTNGTLQSIDASNPASPVFQGELKSGPVRLGNASGIKVDGDYAYITAFGSNGVEILDISDSANPNHISSITDESNHNELLGSWDLEKSGDYLFISGYYDRGIEVIDVSNPNNPIGIARILDSNSVELQNPRGMYIAGNYLYVVSYNGDSLQVIDISTPSNPVALGFYKNSSILNSAQDVVVSGNYAYVTSYVNDSVAVIDVSNPNSLNLISTIDDISGRELNGAWDMDIHNNKIYVSSYVDDAVIIIDISNPTNPSYLGDFDDNGSIRLNGPRGVIYDEGYAYLVTYNDDSLVSIDVSDPANPMYIDEIRNTTLYERSSKVDKKENDIFFTQYLGSSFSVVRESYSTSSPYIIPDIAVNSPTIYTLTETLGDYNEGNITYQLSNDNGVNWYYHDGSNWIATTGGTNQSNSAAVINAHSADFNALSGGTNQIKWKAFLNSNGSQKVELKNISIETNPDSTPPDITSINFASGSLLPGGNHDIEIYYSDTGSLIDTGSANISLHRWDGVSSWGSDESATYITAHSISSSGAVYSMNNLESGKYQYRFSIDDNEGNTAYENVDFYIDKPEFIVSTPEIDIGDINSLNSTFSNTITITVRTIGAAFEVYMKNATLLEYNGHQIQNWDGTTGYGYEESPFNGNIHTISEANKFTQARNINVNGDKNEYIYELQLGAIVADNQYGGEYLGSVDFNIDLDY